LAVVLLYVLLCGCRKAPPKPASALFPQGPAILDEILTNATFSNALEAAFVELPTDEWDKGPKPYNVSQSQRLYKLGKPVFEELKPRLKEMSISNLVCSLKVVDSRDAGLYNDWSRAAECVYSWGNREIIAEIKRRPLNELNVLRKFDNDRVTIWEGYAGFGLPLTYQLDEILQDVREDATNRASR